LASPKRVAKAKRFRRRRNNGSGGLNYFLSELVDEAGAAGAGADAGVLAGADSLLVELDEASPELEEEVPASLLVSPRPDFFELLYRSAYQPPPLNDIAGAWSICSSGPPQCGHTVSGASENFRIFSMRRLHCWHSYS
jgi:hypothetical protein